MRARIAAAAARLMAEDGIDDFAQAKRKAARQLGAADTESLPANDEVEAELVAYRALYQATEHPERIAELRRVALQAMRAFERRYLSALLEKNNQNVSSAARAAGVDRSNFRRLLKQYEVAGRSMKPRQPKMDEGGALEAAS